MQEDDDDPIVWNLLDRAAALPPEDRAPFLDAACADDPARRAGVQALLDAIAPHDAPSAVPNTPDDGLRQDADPSIANGTVIAGRYRLLEQVGAGGMGEVWAAEQTRPVRRRVALKLIKPGMDSRSVLSRFDAERQALAVMDHPNIAKVLDAGATKHGRPFFVMEYVEGVRLTQYCDDARLDVRERLSLFIHVCHAVHHAHQKGIIHRDLKPSNILVATFDGRPVPKVIDFGLAKAMHEPLAGHTLHTLRGDATGTPLYMSPEQADPCNRDVDTRSDIYSLGVTLYELLSGSTPLDKQQFKSAAWNEVVRLIREEDPPAPSARLSGSATLSDLAALRRLDPARLPRLIRGDLDWIVMKALDKERARRYESASAFAADLQRYLFDEPVLARPPLTGYRVRKFVRRNKAAVLAAILVVFALLAGTIGATWGFVRASAAKTDAVNAANQKDLALQNARDRLWWSLYERARARRVSRLPGQRLDSLAALAEAALIRPDDRLRDEAIAAMALADVRRVPAGPPLPVGGIVAYAARRQLSARADPDGTITICRTHDGQTLRQNNDAPIAPGCCLYFSPDERHLLGLVGNAQELRVWRVDDGQPVLRDRPRGCWAHSFSPDGKRLAVGQIEWVLLFDLTAGQEIARWRMPGPINALAFHPDNARLAVGHTNSTVVSICDALTGTRLTDLAVGSMAAQVVAWHPDGERLAVGGGNPIIQLWNVPAKRKIATLAGHVSNVTSVPFHPDGDLLASHSWDGVLRLWECAAGRPLLQVPMAVAGRPRFGLDGRWPAAGLQGESAELLEVVPSREYRTLVSSAGAGAGGYRHYADISPNGRFLAVGMDDGARIWDLAAGREVATLPAGTAFAFFDANRDPAARAALPALLTSGSNGLWRWPLTIGDDERHTVRLGEPQKLSGQHRAWFARAADGRTLAVATEEGGRNHLLDLETGAVRHDFGVHPNGEVMALSPDGRWAASSGWHSDRVRLWDAATGEMAHEWAVGKQAAVYFTPDSLALIISRGEDYAWHDVRTFQCLRRLPRDVRQFPGHVAFSADGKLMALEMAPGVIDLMDASTARAVARFTDPHADRARWQSFTPDGTTLVTLSRDASAIHLWNLRVIRKHLKEMNLDWDWPDFQP